MKIRVVVSALVLFLAAFTASAQTGTWTAVGSTGIVDPAQAGLFGVVNGTQLGFPGAGSGAATIIARYNVTNTWGGGTRDTPPWTTLEVGAVNSSAFDPVSATLYRVNPCTGARTAICTATNTISNSCATCIFPSTTFNFATNLYYVEVSITRSTGTGSPRVTTLRIR